jgi:6-phosphogluconolactonase (cycloisomerase 2 family)
MLIALTLATLTLGLTSCGAFFQCEGKSDCAASTTSTICTPAAATTVTGTIYGYAANSSCGTSYLNGYTLSGGALSDATSAPFNLDYVPQAMVVTPSNSYLYVATDSAVSSGDIYGYTISTGGVLNILSSGGTSALASENSAALAVSADGKYLFSLNTLLGTIEQYTIGSTGLLSSFATYTIQGSNSGGSIVPSALAFAPNGGFLVAALGTGGADIFVYNSSTGVLGSGSGSLPTYVINSNVGYGIYGVTVDANNYIYAAGTGGITVYAETLTSNATTTTLTTTQKATYSTGGVPYGIVVNSTNSYLYAANFNESNISAFSVANGVLTEISGSPFSGPTNVISIGITSGGGYLLADGYNGSTGIQLFSIGSGGILSPVSSTSSGTSTTYPAPVAMSH